MKLDRPLEGCMIGLSLSTSPELAQLGFTSRDVDRVTLTLSESLLGAGARLLFGHDWRPGGIMEAVASLAVTYRRPPGKARKDEAPICNRLAPPDEPFLSPKQASKAKSKSEKRQEPNLDHSERFTAKLRAALRGLVDAQTIEWTPEPGENSEVARANALSALRRELTRLCDARVCVGGPVEGFEGWFGGIVEEAQLALVARKPLYVSALFGGAGAQVVHALGRKRSASFSPRKITGGRRPPLPLVFDQKPIGNGLTPSQNRALFAAESVDAFVELTLGGLIRWRAAERELAHRSKPRMNSAD